MKLNKNRGFTLLEIIIVIIIVGVLASLALPKLFSTVEFSRSAEALSNLQASRGAIERCQLQTSSYILCNTFSDLDLDDPTTSVGTHFGYSINAVSDAFTIVATRNALNGGDASGASFVWLSVDTADIQKGGSGAFQGIK